MSGRQTIKEKANKPCAVVRCHPLKQRSNAISISSRQLGRSHKASTSRPRKTYPLSEAVKDTCKAPPCDGVSFRFSPREKPVSARIETVETAASYQGPWSRNQRCLQVATGFYEWHLDDQGRKAPFYIHLVDQDLFGFAGLWDRSYKADGSAVESCVHITMPGNDLMRHVHNTGNNPFRMPVIVRRQDQGVWLNGTVEQARAVLKPYDQGMIAYEVTTAVNAPTNDSPDNIVPVDFKRVE